MGKMDQNTLKLTKVRGSIHLAEVLAGETASLTYSLFPNSNVLGGLQSTFRHITK